MGPTLSSVVGASGWLLTSGGLFDGSVSGCYVSMGRSARLERVLGCGVLDAGSCCELGC
jgi:hypothetical protein